MVQVLIFVYVRLNFIIVCKVILAAGSVVVGRARNMKFGENNLDIKKQPRKFGGILRFIKGIQDEKI